MFAMMSKAVSKYLYMHIWFCFPEDLGQRTGECQPLSNSFLNYGFKPTSGACGATRSTGAASVSRIFPSPSACSHHNPSARPCSRPAGLDWERAALADIRALLRGVAHVGQAHTCGIPSSKGDTFAHDLPRSSSRPSASTSSHIV